MRAPELWVSPHDDDGWPLYFPIGQGVWRSVCWVADPDLRCSYCHERRPTMHLARVPLAHGNYEVCVCESEACVAEAIDVMRHSDPERLEGAELQQ